MPGKVSILSTAELSEGVLATASQNGVETDVLPFIEITPLATEATIARIDTLCRISATVVFTSVNAVSSVRTLCTADPEWEIYCIGGATRAAIENAFPVSTVIATAPNGSCLADDLIKDDVRDVVFFCGNIRHDALPAKLEEANVNVEEIIVYTNTPLQHRLEKKHDGILFFSPSGVESYFDSNTPSNSTVLFAIGNTTADTVRKYRAGPLVICAAPSKEDLVQTAIDYFNLHLIAK